MKQFLIKKLTFIFVTLALLSNLSAMGKSSTQERKNIVLEKIQAKIDRIQNKIDYITNTKNRNAAANMLHAEKQMKQYVDSSNQDTYNNFLAKHKDAAKSLGLYVNNNGDAIKNNGHYVRLVGNIHLKVDLDDFRESSDKARTLQTKLIAAKKKYPNPLREFFMNFTGGELPSETQTKIGYRISAAVFAIFYIVTNAIIYRFKKNSYQKKLKLIKAKIKELLIDAKENIELIENENLKNLIIVLDHADDDKKEVIIANLINFAVNDKEILHAIESYTLKNKNSE